MYITVRTLVHFWLCQTVQCVWILYKQKWWDGGVGRCDQTKGEMHITTVSLRSREEVVVQFSFYYTSRLRSGESRIGPRGPRNHPLFCPFSLSCNGSTSGSDGSLGLNRGLVAEHTGYCKVV